MIHEDYREKSLSGRKCEAEIANKVSINKSHVVLKILNTTVLWMLPTGIILESRYSLLVIRPFIQLGYNCFYTVPTYTMKC